MQMAAPYEMLPAHEYTEEEDNEPFYYCAYCNTDQGHDFMEQMCADCYWEWDSLWKSTRRTSRLLTLTENSSPDKQKQIINWIQDEKKRLREFEETLKAGQDRIHQELKTYEVYGELGTPKIKTFKEMTDEEINSQLLTLDEERKQLRVQACGREMTPQEKDACATMDRAAQACVDELQRRRG